MVTYLERGADLHMAQLMPLPLTVSCFNEIQIGFTFLVLAHLGSPRKGPLNGLVCVCVCTVMVTVTILTLLRAGWRSPVCCQIQRLLQLFTSDNAAE